MADAQVQMGAHRLQGEPRVAVVLLNVALGLLRHQLGSIVALLRHRVADLLAQLNEATLKDSWGTKVVEQRQLHQLLGQIVGVLQFVGLDDPQQLGGQLHHRKPILGHRHFLGPKHREKVAHRRLDLAVVLQANGGQKFPKGVALQSRCLCGLGLNIPNVHHRLRPHHGLVVQGFWPP